MTKGKLSQLQLEGVLYACTKHQQFLPNGQRESQVVRIDACNKHATSTHGDRFIYIVLIFYTIGFQTGLQRRVISVDTTRICIRDTLC